MDDPTFNRVVTEISTFYRAITAPFLSRMPDNEKEKAILWSQRVLDSKNYDSMVKYLTFLSFMIINGHLVTPFDTDPLTMAIPPLPVHFGEAKMLEYIEKVAAQCQSSSNQNQNDHSTPGDISAAISSDELAFLSTQPTPGVGIRLYMATSAQPFSMWSKAEGAPQAVKYSVPAREVIDRGLSLAKDKFYSYLEEIDKLNRQSKATTKCANCQRQSGNVGQGVAQSENLNQSRNESAAQSSLSQSRDISDEELDSSFELPSDFRFNQDAMSGPNLRPERPVPAPAPPASVASVPSISADKRPIRNYKLRPAEPLSEEDQRKEAEVEARLQRWFPHPEYDFYRGEIRNFIRGGTRIDGIRRAVHRRIRSQYENPAKAPFFTLDSMDDNEAVLTRLQHLQQRYADVLEKEYGIKNEADIYYLVGVVGTSEEQMVKARTLIQKAEEGLVDPAIKERFRTSQGQCGKLTSIVDELMNATREDVVSVDASQAAPATPGTASRLSRIPRFVRTAPGRRLTRMPPTSLLDERSDDADDSNRSYLENESEPEFFRSMHEVENNSQNNSQNESNQSFDISRERPPDSFYSLPDTSQESNSEPDGRVYPYCPRENC